MTAFRWYVPTFYGDINLEPADGGTIVRFDSLTPGERAALDALWRQATAEGWTKAALVSPLRLNVAIEVAQDTIARSLKPDRRHLSAVRFHDGAMEEITTASADAREAKTIAQRALDLVRAAVTVAAPRTHCPTPEFERAEVRARDVLFTFLTEEQRSDFRRYNRFVSVGADTGHRYMISSRHALDMRYRRSLYDIDERLTLCTRDWDVPAAEEMLVLHLVVSLRGREQQIRELSVRNRPIVYCIACNGCARTEDWLYARADTMPCTCKPRDTI